MYNRTNPKKASVLKLTDKQLLIFDLDGTLINSALDLAKSVNYMLAELGREMFDEEVIHGWVGNGALMLVSRALSGSREPKRDLDEKYVQKALDIFLEHYATHLCCKTQPYPYVAQTLKELQQRYRLAIVTNKPFRFVEPILRGLELDGLFEMILGGDSLPRKKPDPMPLLHLCNTLDIPVKASVMVGDSKNDILAANACGMDSVGVTYGYNYGEDIGEHNPTVIINNFKELLGYL